LEVGFFLNIKKERARKARSFFIIFVIGKLLAYRDEILPASHYPFYPPSASMQEHRSDIIGL
jgi:hypothetical protein